MAKLHAGLVSGPCCFLALEQTSGRGQRGKQWLVNPGDNITMTSIFSPQTGISANVAAFPFLFSAAIALGCYDFIKGFGVSAVSVKWPNDVYVGDRKAAGILIENVYQGTAWKWSVVGTGINVNQVEFDEHAGRPISLKMITGEHYDMVSYGRKLYTFLKARIRWLSSVSAEGIMDEYNAALYKKRQTVKLKKQAQVFEAHIEMVSASGELVTSGSIEKRFNVGEVEFV